MEDTFRTLTSVSEGEVSEKRSKFLAFAHPVSTADEAKELVKAYQKRFFDARHVCYAYRLGYGAQALTRANDNGEPSGTAGKPILGQITAFDLTDVLVVVVRYFGGVKLGTGGLVQAYKAAAAAALAEAAVEERHIHQQLTVSFAYPTLNAVMRVVKEREPRVVAQTFEIQCTMTLSIRQSQYEALHHALSQIDDVIIEEEQADV